MTWRTISSAPTDGTRVLLYRASDGVMVVGWWDEKYRCWWIVSDWAQFKGPTHWAVLPEGPA